MTVRRRNTTKENTVEQNIEQELEAQIGSTGALDIEEAIEEYMQDEEHQEAPVQEERLVGQKLSRMTNGRMRSMYESEEDMTNAINRNHLSRVGDNISKSAEFRDGWIDVDRALLGERDIFYPSEWIFRIKPATVEAIRNWSAINDENPNSIDDVFDEILKSCLAIRTPNGPMPWNAINTWDRFFFVLLIREYTFEKGEQKIAFTDTCPNCEVEVPFELNSLSLMYDLPDESVMEYYNQEERTWTVYPADFDVETPVEAVELYIPTREKDANIKLWLINQFQENRNFKVEHTFMKFLPWILPKVSKDPNIAKKQIDKASMTYKSWNIEMFSFMDDVITNIEVTPSTSIVSTCPSCGEEVTTPIRFPNGISALFNMVGRHKKFGKK